MAAVNGDGPHKKAWQGGQNPITQRASSNHAAEKPKSSTTDMDKHAHDRLLFLLAHCIGTDATLTMKTGEQFTGVYSGASTDNPNKSTYVLKMVKRTKLPSGQQINGHHDLPDEYIGEGADHVMSFDIQDTTDFAVSNVVTTSAPGMQNGSATSSFRTDTEISNRANGAQRERELQRWDGGLDMSLENMSLEASGSKGWDQFATNEEKFGTQTTYDEDEYTTSIDRSHPEYRRRAAEAERLAREIEGSTAANSHVAEERRQNGTRDDGQDEEDKYSGVRRNGPALPRGAAGSYVPPSRRPLTNVPTVPGAPFDPAIISIARPTSRSPALAGDARAMPEIKSSPSSDEVAAKDVSKQDVPAASVGNDSAVPAPQVTRKAEHTTEDHVRGTAEAFKQFANNEKLRMRQVQEQKRMTAKHEKTARLTDLKKFAENFKLKSRVPDDLVPILAKDHEKQLEIKRKAETSAKEEEERAKAREKDKATPSPQKQPPAAVSNDARLQPQLRTRQPQNSRMPHSNNVPRFGLPAEIPPFSGTRKPIAPLSMNTPGLPTPTSIRSPTSATTASSATNALNAKASAFHFRPGVSSFTPSGASPSPQRQSVAVAPSTIEADFFENKPKTNEKNYDVDVDYDIVKRLKNADYPAEHKKSLINGLPAMYRTLPTWSAAAGCENKSWKDMFAKAPARSHGPSPLPTPNSMGSPMNHQLPQHMQGPPHMPSPGQGRFQPQQQQMYGQNAHPQAFDPRMQYGPNGSVQNSPRYNNAQMAYVGNQMGQMPVQQMPQFGAPQMPPYGMSPSMGYRQPQAPPGPQFMMQPNQPQPHLNQMRGGYPPNPAFQQQGIPPMGGHQMVHSHSTGGGYMPNGMPPNQPNFNPHMHGTPQHMSQQPNGYANSPRPGPPMMQLSASQQGFNPNMPPQHMQYGASPSQPPYLQPQSRQASNGGYPQMTPRSQQAMPQQNGQPMPSPGMGGPGFTPARFWADYVRQGHCDSSRTEKLYLPPPPPWAAQTSKKDA